MIPLRRRLYSHAVRARRVLHRDISDVTGNQTSFLKSADVSSLDDIIMDILGCSRSSFSSLDAMCNVPGSPPIACALLALELLRKPSIGQRPTKAVFMCIQTLESFNSEGKLNAREMYLASAAVAYFCNNHCRAGLLLECSLKENPADVLVLKLAQDCYQRGGSLLNVLGCVTRSVHALDENHFLRGYILGMQAAGYFEMGRLVEAEELAERAVTTSRGRDLLGLQTLLGVFQISGRSSETLATIETHASKHEDADTGLVMITFFKGLAHVQRGNYTASTKCLEALIELVLFDKTNISCLPVVYSALLLQNIRINKGQDSSTCDFWLLNELAKLCARAMEDRVSRTPLMEVSCAIVFATHANMVAEGHAERSTPPSGPATGRRPTLLHSLFPWMEIKQSDPSEEEKSAAARIQQEVGVVIDSSALLVELLHEMTFTTAIEGQERGGGKEGEEVDYHNLVKSFALSKIEPTIRLNIFPSLGEDDVNRGSGGGGSGGRSRERTSSQAVTKDICKAMKCFIEGDHVKAARLLNARRHDLALLGGTAIERQVIEQTLVEALLRSDQLYEAQLLLLSRTVQYPNDAQAWRRLASVFGSSGNEAMAKVAHYTAWQLGIGQGGFGGPR